jgi:DNA recombination protein RmuC
MSLSIALVVVAAVLVGGALGWLAAGRAADASRHALELQLAALRTQLAAREGQVQQLDQRLSRLTQEGEQRSSSLAHAQAAAARAEAAASLLTEQAAQQQRSQQALEARAAQLQDELSSATARLAKTAAELEASAAVAARVPALEARVAELAEALTRCELDVAAERTRADLRSIEAAGAASLRAQAQDLGEALVRHQAEARAQLDVRTQLEAELAALRPLRDEVLRRASELAAVTAALEAERQRTAERLADAEKAREMLKLEVQSLGQQLLEEKGKALLELNHQGLEGLLSPVRDSLKAFQDQFQRNVEEAIRDRASLLQQVRGLQEAQGRLSAEANALARALTGDSRAQGDWGEAVLERLLESAGLQEGVHFDLQLDHVTDEGKHRRPDALVYLPGDRAIVIDSKCSLTAFVESNRAVDEEVREGALAAHCASMRGHAKDLSKKDYTALLEQRSPDFVLMFVPSEAAFQAALRQDAALVDDAYRSGKVVICSPTTVLATLQMVHHVWRTERQTTNAQRIADEAGKMVDKVSGTVEALARLGAALQGAQAALDDARARIATGRGSMLSFANKVSKLGARVKGDKLAAANRAFTSEPEGADGGDDEPAPQGALLLQPGGQTPSAGP